MDEVQGVVPWHHFLLVMGLPKEAGTFGQTTHILTGMQLMLLCVHGRTGYRAGCQSHPSGTISPRASKFETGNVHSPASAHDRRYTTDHNASPVRASNPHSPTVTWRAGCAGCADHEVSPAGGRHRRAKPSEPRVAPGGSPQPRGDPFKVAPISLIHSLLIGASGRAVRGTGFGASRVAMRNGRSDTRWQVPR